MNAIVAGKVEKPEGSMTFKNLESFIPDIEWSWTYSILPSSETLAKCNCIRITGKITKNNSQTYFCFDAPHPNVSLGNVNFTSPSFGFDWITEQQLQVSNETEHRNISNYISLIEIGTLE